MGTFGILLNSNIMIKEFEKNHEISNIELTFPNLSKIINYGHTQITNKFLYSITSDLTVPGGILDFKMGANKKKFCSICKNYFKKCLGHFGYLKLLLPVFNIGYIKTIHIILRMICKACSRVLIEPIKKYKLLKKIRKNRKKGESHRVEYLNEIIQECQNSSICPYCFSKNGIVKRLGFICFVHEGFPGKNSQKLSHRLYKKDSNFSENILNPLTIFFIFQKIKFEDLEILDIDEIESRPENLLLSYVPIPPLTIRPSIFVKDKMSNEDDLTLKLSEIQNTNVKLKKDFENNSCFSNLKDIWNILQIECARYLNSEAFPNENGGKIFKSLFQRLKGKNGRFRGNLSGKRVDFSGRTIISPDPNLPLNIVGIPFQLATKLTFPEKVTKINLKRIERNILRGSLKFPGAICLIDNKRNKQIINDQTKKKIFLNVKIGFKIERHLKNNDIILFNRQPSLHRISIMAHRVRVIQGKTFKFNECVCKPYNADFDGDEMNIHIPQTQKSRAEAISLLNLVLNLNSPGTGESQVAATQDFLSTTFLLTSKDRFFTEIEINTFIGIFLPIQQKYDTLKPVIIKPRKMWTGKQMFSLIFSSTLNESIGGGGNFKNFFNGNQRNCQTKEKLYSLDKNQCSPFLCPYDGWVFFKKGKLLAGQVGKYTLGSGNKNSFISYLLTHNSFNFFLKCLLKISVVTAKWFLDYGFSFGIIEVLPTLIQLKKKKFLISNCYNMCESAQKKSFFCINKKINLEISIQKILANVRNDLGLHCIRSNNLNTKTGSIMVVSGSKGSVINLSQMITCLGQQSVVGNRILKGFIGRVLPHFFTKKSRKSPCSKGFIETSFWEGLDGIDFFFHSMAGREGLVDTAIKTAETGYLQRRMMKTLEDIMVFYDSSTRTSDGRLIQMNLSNDSFDPDRIFFISNPFNGLNKNLEKSQKTKSTAINLFETLTFTRAFSFINMESVPFFVKLRDFYLYFTNSSCIGEVELFVIREHHFHKILENSKKFQIEPGTCVGALAAQSLGEPGTQMTLQTFHFTGVSEMNITLGVPRINEIMNASKNVGSSYTRFDFFSMGEKENFFRFKFEVEKFYLGEMCKKIEVIIEPLLIYVDIIIHTNHFLKLGEGITLKKLIKGLKTLENIPKKSRFFYNRFYNTIRVFPDVPEKKGNFSKINVAQFILSCKKNFPFLIAYGFIESEDIKIYQNNPISVLLVKNTSLNQIFNFDFVDKHSIYCTHILSMFETFGIEASRKAIIFEILTSFRSYKISINKRHLSILADIMTFQGEILGITRYGISKIKQNALVLASFEKTIDNLFLAATRSSRDRILSVSECVILGKKIPTGTGIVCLRPNFQNHE